MKTTAEKRILDIFGRKPPVSETKEGPSSSDEKKRDTFEMLLPSGEKILGIKLSAEEERTVYMTIKQRCGREDTCEKELIQDNRHNIKDILSYVMACQYPAPAFNGNWIGHYDGISIVPLTERYFQGMERTSDVYTLPIGIWLCVFGLCCGTEPVNVTGVRYIVDGIPSIVYTRPPRASLIEFPVLVAHEMSVFTRQLFLEDKSYKDVHDIGFLFGTRQVLNTLWDKGGMKEENDNEKPTMTVKEEPKLEDFICSL